MNRKTILSAVIVNAALAVFLLFSPATGITEVNVSVGIALPPLVFSGPPALVVIPGASYVYYPPEAGVDIFFYHGFWYRPHRGYWYMADGYNGPWRGVAVERVPHAIIGISPGFRKGRGAYEHVPYGDVKRHWRAWEHERHWDRGRGGKREYRGDDDGGKGRGRRGRDHD